jgi:pilus assembly protein Flp/PilA
MQKIAQCFFSDEGGATAIEYAMIASFIGLAIIAAAQGVGFELQSIFADAETGLKKRPGV